MANNETKTSTGVSATFLLFLVFLVLKLTGVITWSWWWVTAPLWVPMALIVAIGVVVFAVAFLYYLISGTAMKMVRKQRKAKNGNSIT